jgi:flagellar biosynthesis GTPase FlhF
VEELEDMNVINAHDKVTHLDLNTDHDLLDKLISLKETANKNVEETVIISNVDQDSPMEVEMKVDSKDKEAVPSEIPDKIIEHALKANLKHDEVLMHLSECIVNSDDEEEEINMNFSEADVEHSEKEEDMQKDNSSGEQMDVTQYMEEVGKPKKESQFDHNIRKQIEKKPMRPAIKMWKSGRTGRFDLLLSGKWDIDNLAIFGNVKILI